MTKGAPKPSDEDILNLKKAYDAMLAKYPLCFGYWKKYADHVNAIDGPVKAAAVRIFEVLAWKISSNP